jgi:hypothetical protein
LLSEQQAEQIIKPCPAAIKSDFEQAGQLLLLEFQKGDCKMRITSFINSIKVSRAVMLGAVAFCFFLLPQGANAQPSDAQVKKDLTGAKTVSVTLGKPGKIEWSSTYKKYVWTRNFTARLRTDAPEIFVIVKGYASYDVMGGRYVYWKSFTTSNNYEGIPDPTARDVEDLIGKFGIKKFIGDYHYQNAAGEIEVLRLTDEPKFEWHTPNSVSFDVFAVFSEKVSYTQVEKVERIFNIRLYRDEVKQPWLRMISTPRGERKVLETKTYTAEQLRRLPGPAKP